MAPLNFDNSWRFTPPSNRTKGIGQQVIEDFSNLILRIATQGDRYKVYERFKRYFCDVSTTPYYPSSSTDWAKYDLVEVMETAAQSAPLFIEAFYDACESLRPAYGIPSADDINRILSAHNTGYEVQPPDLLLHQDHEVIELPTNPPELREEFIETYQASLKRSNQLLTEGRSREAVSELLWLLESVATVFRGAETTTGSITATYFNPILRQLRQAERGRAMDRILEWMKSLHGYLSSPSGGGLRHGVDVSEGATLTPNEAQLFCNLIRSYIGFLLSERQRMQGDARID